MAEVLSPPATTSSPSPHAQTQSPEPAPSLPPLQTSREPRPQPRQRIPSYAQSRMSTYSQRTSRSRPQSMAFPVFHSSLSYALVRDFAYPEFHPMHYGPPPSPPSGATTPGSEWRESRRLSDPMDGWNGAASHGNWSAGPWGGDGAMFGDSQVEPLPSTSFSSLEETDDGEVRGKGKHRKSKSYAHLEDYARGRRRDSQRRSRMNDPEEGGMFYFQGQGQGQEQPSNNDSLRVSTNSSGRGNGRRDSHFAHTLPSRSFHTSQPIDPDSDLPLDSEVPSSPLNPSPQRESMGPEDEAYAGPSLALYSFTPENPNELALTEGQTILVSYRHGQGWLVAEDPTTGEQGLVPEEYVRLLRDIEGWDEETGQLVDLADDSEMYEHDGLQIEEAPDEEVTPVAKKSEGVDQKMMDR